MSVARPGTISCIAKNRNAGMARHLDCSAEQFGSQFYFTFYINKQIKRVRIGACLETIDTNSIPDRLQP